MPDKYDTDAFWSSRKSSHFPSLSVCAGSAGAGAGAGAGAVAGVRVGVGAGAEAGTGWLVTGIGTGAGAGAAAGVAVAGGGTPSCWKKNSTPRHNATNISHWRADAPMLTTYSVVHHSWRVGQTS